MLHTLNAWSGGTISKIPGRRGATPPNFYPREFKHVAGTPADIHVRYVSTDAITRPLCGLFDGVDSDVRPMSGVKFVASQPDLLPNSAGHQESNKDESQC